MKPKLYFFSFFINNWYGYYYVISLKIGARMVNLKITIAFPYLDYRAKRHFPRKYENSFSNISKSFQNFGKPLEYI